MAILIKQARTSKQLLDILEHRSLCHLRRPGRLVDHYDVLPSTLNFVAYQDSKVVGSCRGTSYESSEVSANQPLNFSESAERLTGAIGRIDSVSIRQHQELVHFQLKYLIKMAVLQMSQNGYKHIFTWCRQEHLQVFTDLSFKVLYESNSLFALIIDVSQFCREFELLFADREILRFRDIFYYSLFEGGEVPVVEGERGSTAYVSEAGEIEVIVQTPIGLSSISTIPKGQLIGELAMITNEPRTASLAFRSDSACISFDRTDFLRIMKAEPHRSIEVFRILSRRLTHTNRKIAELKREVKN